MSTEKEKYIGSSKLSGTPSKRLKFSIGEGVIKTKHLADANVTSEKIASGAITEDKLAESVLQLINSITKTISGEQLEDNSIASSKLKDKSIVSSKIDDGAILMQHLSEEIVSYIASIAENAEKTKHIFITEEDYAALTEYEENALYFIVPAGAIIDDTIWRFGGTFPITFSDATSTWVFGSTFPIILV